MTVDAYDSFKDELIVFLKGSLSGRDKLKRQFALTFFLAPQDNVILFRMLFLGM